ncbi:MAG: tRNA 2-thiouridine(34) synthase MnmA, partial [Deltaproteobacteria bacterium]|nr:tRNA 2-thiouridine(34) synthase MnmA [Deltaproteobacteria bacterium]
MKPTVAIALSGGVDSLISAYLLKKQGYPLIGIHFLTGFESDPKPSPHKDGRCEKSAGAKSEPHDGINARQIVEKLANQLDIPIHTVDLTRPFHDNVVAYFNQTYLDGKTPNPCLVCNPTIKFGSLLDAARKLGAQKIATGHYARVQTDSSGRSRLYCGLDRKKDQSYFLAFLTQQQLAHACFPLGKMTKDQVRSLARETGLSPVTGKESQDVCFIKGRTYIEFLAKHTDMPTTAGPIEDTDGNVLGEHSGLHQFTIGQRRGINCPATEPYYVLRIDTEKNRLIVGFKEQLTATACYIDRINWIIAQPDQPIAADTRLRYRHRAAASIIYPAHPQT